MPHDAELARLAHVSRTRVAQITTLTLLAAETKQSARIGSAIWLD